VKAIWKKLRNKGYRDSFVASQISNTIAAQIFVIREARGWTQAEVAAKAGMKQSRISDLEDPNYENYQTRTLVKIASAYDVGLVVRFVPFSELAKWSANLSQKDFLPTEFSKDGIVPEIELHEGFRVVADASQTPATTVGINDDFDIVPPLDIGAPIQLTQTLQ
jgi:transcriptional regulator with XRE-family HTH domain